MLPHHHIQVNNEMRQDLLVWKRFLMNPIIYCHPFIDYSQVVSASTLDWFTDASGKIGFGGYYKKAWFQGRWDEDWIEECKPSIEYMELFAVAKSIYLWGDSVQNKRIYLFCDNQAVVSMINNVTSSCKNCMVLIRKITLKSLETNTRIFAKFVRTHDNFFADTLSRFQMSRFWSLARQHNYQFHTNSERIPEELWPVNKIWLHT